MVHSRNYLYVLKIKQLPPLTVGNIHRGCGIEKDRGRTPGWLESDESLGGFSSIEASHILSHGVSAFRETHPMGGCHVFLGCPLRMLK